MFHKIGEALLDLVYPRYCIGCQRNGTLLCRDCLSEVDFYFLPIRLQLEPVWIDNYLVATRLESLIRKLVHQLKYNGIQELAEVAGELLYLCTEWPEADLVTAVPLHSHRLYERGFNQASLIAKSFAHFANIPYQELLLRTADTPHQAQQRTKVDREQNITDYFALIPSVATSQQLFNKQIILVDDVCTTGITLHYCAKVLKSGHCGRITALTLAHGK